MDEDGGVTLRAPLDFEQHEEMTVQVAAFDGLFYSLENASILVSVFPVNKHKPQFSQTFYEAYISENMEQGAFMPSWIE